MSDNSYDNRSSSPLRREARQGSYQKVTSSGCVYRDDFGCAWNQNFTNAGNEGNQNANNKDNTNNSVRPVRRLSSSAVTFSLEELITAYLDCRKNKRNNLTTIAFESDFVFNMAKIWHEVNTQTWRPKGHMCFVVRSPKMREVWASPFSDRVVHHLVYNRLRPRFEPHFIATSFACIPGRGTGGAAKWAERAANKVTHGWSKPAYAGQLDIANFFPSINCSRLCELLLEKAPEPALAHLVKEIILVDVKKNAHFPGQPHLLKQIPKHKSLWHKPHGIGLPIGNLTSQFGANVLLDLLDQVIVRSGVVRHYGRYVDDIVIMHESLENVQAGLQMIQDELEKLGHQINRDKTNIVQIDYGFDFCGRFIKPHRTYLRRSTVRRANISFRELHASNHPAQTATSYFATARHCNTRRLRVKWAKKAQSVGLGVDQNVTKAYEVAP